MSDTMNDSDDSKNLFKSHGLRLVCTCGACPEQYEVFKGSKQVGYLRLRHGTFRVAYPDCGGKNIYTSHTVGDGMFEDDERSGELQKALNAILVELHKNGVR